MSIQSLLTDLLMHENRICSTVYELIVNSEVLSAKYKVLVDALSIQMDVEYESANKIVPVQAESRAITLRDVVLSHTYSLVQLKIRRESARGNARALYKVLHPDTGEKPDIDMFHTVRVAANAGEVEIIQAIRAIVLGNVDKDLEHTLLAMLRSRTHVLLNSPFGNVYRAKMSGSNPEHLLGKTLDLLFDRFFRERGAS